MTHTDSAGARAASKPLLVIALCIVFGASPTLATVANDVCTGNPCVISSDKNVTPGSVLDFGTRAVVLQKTLNMQNLPSGDVGSMTIKAGSFVISGDGQIKGTGGNRLGGTVQIETSGNIQLNGTRSTGAVRLTGTDAGSLTLISSAGSVSATGVLNVDHEGVIASGGTIAITAAGSVTLSGAIVLDGGFQGSGGILFVDAGGNVNISGAIAMSAGEGGGGEIDLNSGGSLTLGVVTMDGGGDIGDAGFGTIIAGGSVTLTGVYRGRGADTGERCGDGADLDIEAGADVFFNAELDVRARALDCAGGGVTVFASSVFVNNVIRASGDGTEGEGGSLDIDALNLASVPGTVELDGHAGGGGDLAIFSSGDINISGIIDARGTTSLGSGAVFIEIDSAATLTITGQVLADGGIDADAGDMLLSACDLRVQPGAVLSSLGNVGAIDIIVSDSAELHGTFRVASNGLTDVIYGPAANPPNTTGAIFVGPRTLSLDPLLPPCPMCTADEECNDNDACTIDSCTPDAVCSNAPNPTACVDGNPCTDDVCSAGVCSFPPNATPCDDGDECTDFDACSFGSCAAGAPKDCSDANICTVDSCDLNLGCQNEPIVGCVDTDGDGKVDTVDECTTIDWTIEPTTPPNQNPLKMRFGLKKLAGAPGGRSFLFKGLFNPAASASLPIDPAANGVHVYIADEAGPIFEVNLPGGAAGTGCGEKDGWKITGNGLAWKYRNVTGAIPPSCAGGSAQGLVGLSIKDLRGTPTAAIQLKVKVKAAQFDHLPPTELTRVQATLALGAQPSPGMASVQAIEGQCAETLLTGAPIPSVAPKPFCKVKLFGTLVNGVSCKGQ